MPNLLLIWQRIHTYVTAGLAAAVVVTSLGWYVTDLKLDKEILGRAADKLAYENAQREFENKALQEKMRIENENRKRAEEADERYTALLSQYQSGLMRFREAQRQVGGTNLPGTPATASGSDGPGTSAQLPDTLMITFEDAEICAENTARIKIVQEWATKDK